MYAPNHPVDSKIVDARQVRLIDILEHEEAVIRVKTKFHIELVFDSVVIDLFEVDGVVYTRQEPRNWNGSQYEQSDDDGDDVELDDKMETQPFDYEYKTPDDPIDVVRYAGEWNAVNEKHASKLEVDDLISTMTELDFNNDDYLRAGDTQIDI